MKTFLTEHKIYKTQDTPRIEAFDFEDAERKCPAGMIVIGALIEEKSADLNNIKYKINLN